MFTDFFENTGFVHNKKMTANEFRENLIKATERFSQLVNERAPGTEVTLKGDTLSSNAALLIVKQPNGKMEAYQISYDLATQQITTVSVYGDIK